MGAILTQEKKPTADLSLVVVGSKKMTSLNYKFRKINQPTDVLAFAEKDITLKFPSLDGTFYLGEIIICPEVIGAQAKEYGVSVSLELTRIIIHGILHLLGYDHEKSFLIAKKMLQKENEIVTKLFRDESLDFCASLTKS